MYIPWQLVVGPWLIAVGLGLVLYYVSRAWWSARTELRELLADDGRLLDMLADRAKREIDSEVEMDRRRNSWVQPK